MNSTKERKTEFSRNLKKTYEWFSTTFVEKVQQACLDFFDIQEVDIKLFSLSENDSIFIKGSRYFVTKAAITKHIDISVKNSQEIVAQFLDVALGAKENRFELEKMSELEARVITAFNDYLIKGVQQALLPKDRIEKNARAVSECNMVFCMMFPNGTFGKLVVTVPTNLLEPKEIEVDEENMFSIYDFRHATSHLRIKIGSSKLTLGDVKSIRKDDLLLLENSDIYKMTIYSGEDEIEFSLNPDPSIILDTEDEDEVMEENSGGGSNLWDSIQVDIVAEFDKVKISLGELKQISEGLVVDIGSIYENKVDLRVENKIVARGELVILNDRYGVRIDEVLQEREEEEYMDEEEEFEEADEDTTEDEAQEEYEDEDFNYDEFEENSDI